MRLALWEDARRERVGVEDRGAERAQGAGGVHLRGEGDAGACEGQDGGGVTVHDALDCWEGFVDLERVGFVCEGRRQRIV